MNKIYLSNPSITSKEIAYVKHAAAKAWGANANFYTKKFETKFSQYLGMDYAVALPSCTSAIHLSLVALGIKPNDEIIVPDVTWIGTSAPISYVGAKPIFCDIDDKTWCISEDSFEELITKNTKAVIPVDLYGNVYNHEKIKQIIKDNNINNDIKIIEDAAEAIGSSHKDKKAGSFGNIGVFSFHASKTLTTGEGGMLVTNNKDIYEKALILRNHGRNPADNNLFWNVELGYKYKMSELQAALGCAQLRRIDELVNRKIQIFNTYKNELKDLLKDNIITINYESPNIRNTYWLVTIILNPMFGIRKEKIVEHMKTKNIDCRPFFYPLSMLPVYNKENNHILNKYKELNINSYSISPYGINLPSGFDIDETKIKYVCDCLKNFIYSKSSNIHN